MEASAPVNASRFAVAQATLAVSLVAVAWVALVLVAPGMGDPETFGSSRLRDQRVFAPLWKRTPSGRSWRPVDRRLANRSFPAPSAGSPGLVRVFVLGESTVFGLGTSENASFPRALERRLEAAPVSSAGAGPFVVVNCGIMGLAARQVALVEKDLVRLRQEEQGAKAARDVFVFEVGNTEFLELMALRALERKGGETAAMKLDRTLERFRLYALLKGSAPAVFRALTPRVPWESPLDSDPVSVTAEERARAVDRYAADLARLVESARAAGAVPVLSTVPVNLEWAGGKEPREGWLASAAGGPLAADAAERKRQLEQAKARLDERLARNGSPLEHWLDRIRRAHVLLALEDGAAARAELVLASDEDPYLLRCLSSMNDRIRKLAKDTSAVLADPDRALAGASGNGIPGFRFFFDNAHLTPEGSERVAEELHRALAEAHLVPALEDPTWVERRSSALAEAREDSLSVREWLGWNGDRSLLADSSPFKLDRVRKALDEKIARGGASAEELVWAGNGHALRVDGEGRARELWTKARERKPELSSVVLANMAWLDDQER